MKNIKYDIIDCLIRNSNKFPDKQAFQFLNDDDLVTEHITYRELLVKVQFLAAKLHSLQGCRALLAYQDTLEFIISFLACQYTGIIAVPVFFGRGKKQLKKLTLVMDDARVSAILTSDNLVNTINENHSIFLETNGIVVISTIVSLNEDLSIPQNISTDDETAFIQYTSGSTDMPKGVVITKRNLIHNQTLIEKVFGCNEASKILCWLPFHHDMGLIGNILHSIYVGCTCYLMSPFDFMQKPQRWLTAISKYKITHSGGPNFAYDLCISAVSHSALRKIDLSSWKVAYNGSEPIRQGTINKFIEYFGAYGFNSKAFYPCYGLAESTLLVSGNKINTEPTTIFIENKSGTKNILTLSEKQGPDTSAVVGSGGIGDEMDVKIISSDNQTICKELMTGEICISGPSVTGGYWNRNQNDIFYTIKGVKYLRTGDIGFIHKHELFVHGRLKEMIIIRGANYYPYDIEKLVAESNVSIENNGVAVFSFTDIAEEFVIVAEIKRIYIKDLNASELISIIDKSVISQLGISPFDIVLTTPLGIPRTTSGKLQRIKCRDNYLKKTFKILDSKLNLVSKSPKIEKNELLALAAKQLGSDKHIKDYLEDLITSKVGNSQTISWHANPELSEIGLDSLRTMELINTINKDLNINLDVNNAPGDHTLNGIVEGIANLLWLKNEVSSEKGITI